MNRRFPWLLTLCVLLLFGGLVRMGVWQLERRAWKHDLIARLEAAPRLPLLTPADYYRSLIGVQSVQYRRAELPCTPGDVLPYDLKGGTSRGGVGGFLVLVSCRPNKKPPEIVAVAGWSRRPDLKLRLQVDTVFRGLIIERPYGKAAGRPQFMLIPDTAVPPLEPSQLPTPGELPDNHLSYAVQWFGIAAALLGVYAMLLWRRLRPPAAPAPAPTPTPVA